MVLRLFSKSSSASKDAKREAKGSTTPLPADASAADIAAAIRRATSSKERVELIGRLHDSEALKALSTEPHCLTLCADRLADLESPDAALTLATSLDTRVELAIHSHNSALRDAQIAAMTTEHDLVELERASRSKNKACNRAARERLDALRHARSGASEAAATAAQLSAHAGKLDSDAHIEARFTALALKHSAAADQHAASSTILNTFGEPIPTLVAMPAAPTIEAPAAADEGVDFDGLSRTFANLQQQLLAGTPASELHDQMGAAGQSWREAIATATPAAAAIDRVASAATLFDQVTSCETLLVERSEAIDALLTQTPKLATAEVTDLPRDKLKSVWKQRAQAEQQNKLIDELSRGLRYPAQVPRPARLTALQERKAELGAFAQACKARQSKLEESFNDQVKRLDQALEGGEMKRAEAARGEARALQDALPGGSANATRKRYGALIANMQNLRDWQHFATDPKRDELCEQMTALADAPKDPDEQADLVKILRAQWNALGGKGPKEVAERFDAAAVRAFEPCRAHYAELAEVRDVNLATRKAILEQLEAFVSDTDWSHADLTGARTILNSARTEWRNAFPVERGANRGLEKRFKVATDALYAHLQDGWSGNLAAKEALVTTAEALLASEDPLTQRLDAAKRLQNDWKKTGPVPRGPDQKLWKRFRSACDALFNARDEERTLAQAEYAVQKSAANALLDSFEQQLAATDAVDLERTLLTELKTNLGEIDQLDRGVTMRARDLEDRFTAKIKEKAAAQKQATLTQLKTLDETAAASELAGQPIAAAVIEVDKLFAERAAGEDHAHLDLVLEAETQAGIESPATDAQRRLELQVQWLNAGMNSGARKSASAMELVQRWCSLSASNTSNELRERLFAAAAALL